MPPIRRYSPAQYNLGIMYGKGLGVPVDMNEAAKWLRKAAEQGNADAQYSLGAIYANGEGFTRNRAEAEKWLRMSATQGHVGAQKALRMLGLN